MSAEDAVNGSGISNPKNASAMPLEKPEEEVILESETEKQLEEEPKPKPKKKKKSARKESAPVVVLSPLTNEKALKIYAILKNIKADLQALVALDVELPKGFEKAALKLWADARVNVPLMTRADVPFWRQPVSMK